MNMTGEQLLILGIGLALLFFGAKKGKAAVAAVGAAVAVIILITTVEVFGTKATNLLSGLIDLIKGLFS